MNDRTPAPSCSAHRFRVEADDAAHEPRSTLRAHKRVNGEFIGPHALVVAHRTLPLGTRIHVRNMDNVKAFDVVVAHRGPYEKRRILDASPAVAARLGHVGTAHVELFKR